MANTDIVILKQTFKGILACQKLRVGSSGADKLAGQLRCNNLGLLGFTAIEEKIALAELGLSKEIIRENLDIEKLLSLFDANREK